MRAGQLRHWLLIEQKSLSVDANGDRTETWATYAECWGSIETSGGREFFAAKQTISDLTHAITVRYKAGITADMRVKYIDPKNSDSARYFNIRSIANPDERNETLSLQCSEVTI